MTTDEYIKELEDLINFMLNDIIKIDRLNSRYGVYKDKYMDLLYRRPSASEEEDTQSAMLEELRIANKHLEDLCLEKTQRELERSYSSIKSNVMKSLYGR